VANEARNRGRSARRREGLATRVAASEAGQVVQSPERAVLERTEAEALVLALERLPERDRLVLAYRYLLELGEAETAELLGVRPGTVRSRLSRALVRLRAEVAASTSFAEVDER
jgi:RNA polymerase sigma-70 factor (ECF subfamily)